MPGKGRKTRDPPGPGVASALIYQPGVYAKTDGLIALAEVAARYHGIYISHMRNEGDREPEAIDELITIARQARIPAEIHHSKVSGEKNWPPVVLSTKYDSVLAPSGYTDL